MADLILYKIQARFPEAHLFELEMRVAQPDPNGQVLTLPAWIPGSYMIRDFAKNIVTLAARCGDTRLVIDKLDKQTWKCAPCVGELIVNYQVYAWDLSVRSAHLDTTHAYFNGTSVFLRAVGMERQSCRVEILPPEGERYSHWRLATTLPVHDAEPLGFGLFLAANYEELVDHPVEMGSFTYASFKVESVPHEIVISGRHHADMPRLCEDLEAICQQHINLFGELPSMDRYLFQVMAVGDGYGGLEHRSSTSLICSRSDLPQKGQLEVTEGYRRYLGLCSHEYFHLWNVKRIRPAALQTADLSREVHTSLLWLFEGITSYYDDLALVRSGRIKPESYIELLAQLLTRVIRGSGRLKQTLAESSFDAWTKFYQQDENAANAIVSYYSKGALAALCLDLIIRQRTDGNRSLDDVMRALWQKHGKTAQGVREGDFEALTKRVTTLDLTEYFELALHSTEDLPTAKLLEDVVAVGCQLRPARNQKDQGGIYKSDTLSSVPGPRLGIMHKAVGGDLILSAVLDNGAAQQAGLSAGDSIVAVDGIRVPTSGLDEVITRYPVGESITIHAFRRDELMRFELQLTPPVSDTCDLWLRDDSTAKQTTQRNAWLGISG